ncbi:DNA-binding protein [Apiospora arundinis]
MTHEGIAQKHPGRNGVSRYAIRAPLPVTASVNQESRQETFRGYSSIPALPESHPAFSRHEGADGVRGMINYEIDVFRFDCCPPEPLDVSQYPAALLQKVERIETKAPYTTFYHAQSREGHNLFDDFLRCVVLPHLPSLRELRFKVDDGNRILESVFGRNVFLRAVDRVKHAPMFLRAPMLNRERSGVLFSSEDCTDGVTFSILFIDERDVAHYVSTCNNVDNGDEDDGDEYGSNKETDLLHPREAQDRLGFHLWHLFCALHFLNKDKVVHEVLGQCYFLIV